MRLVILTLLTALTIGCGSKNKQNIVTSDHVHDPDHVEYFESMQDPDYFHPNNHTVQSEQLAKEKSISIIKEFEGFRAKRYKCFSGKTTLGYGLTSQYIKGKYTVTKKQAHKDLVVVYEQLQEQLDYGNTKLTENQKASLVSLGFNIGMTRLNNSTLMKEIRNGNIKPELIKQFVYARNSKGKMIKLDGLVKRRNAEYNLFIS